MRRSMIQAAVLLLALLLAMPLLAAKEDKQGHGAGGMRDEHASEQGMEHGKSWAGEKEKKPEDEEEEGNGEEEKPKKEKKEKKEKKNK